MADHGPCQFVGFIALLRPKTVGTIVLLQAASLVFLSAAARARVVPSDLFARLKSHNAVTLPRGIREDKWVLEDMSRVMTELTGFPENSVTAISRWALASWFPEMQPAPGLSLIGPDTTAGRQLFELLHSLCQHSLLRTKVCPFWIILCSKKSPAPSSAGY